MSSHLSQQELSTIPLLLPIARADVLGDGIAEDVFIRVTGAHVGSHLADHHCQLHFEVHLLQEEIRSILALSFRGT